MDQNDGVAGADFTEFMVNGKTPDMGGWAFIPFGLMPSAANDPLSRDRRSDCNGHPVDDLLPAAGVSEIQSHERLAKRHVVAVSFNESGNGQLSVQIDNPGARRHIGVDFSIASHRNDPIVASRQGFHPGPGGIHGEYLPVFEDQVG